MREEKRRVKKMSPIFPETSQNMVILARFTVPNEYNFLARLEHVVNLLRVSEANEVPISSHIWVGLSTLNRL